MRLSIRIRRQETSRWGQRFAPNDRRPDFDWQGPLPFGWVLMVRLWK